MPTKKDNPKSTSKFFNKGYDEGYENGRNEGFKEGIKKVATIDLKYVVLCLIEIIKNKFDI